MKMPRLFTIILTGLCGAGPVLAAGDWPNWRGPTGSGVADAAKAPAEFGPEKNVAWKVKLPGRGCSTPMGSRWRRW